MEAERAPWESVYRDIERLVDPTAVGGFSAQSPGALRGLDNFDATAISGLDRFEAALGYVTVPKNQRWHGVSVVDKDLARVPAVKRWCQHATDRLFAMRYASFVGATVQYSEDRRQLGSYGTSGLWVDEWKGRGFFYKTIHQSELFIDEDFRGRVTIAHRKFELTAEQALGQFGEEALSPKMRQALERDETRRDKFQILHVVRPNAKREADKLDWRGKPVESAYIAVDEKWILKRGGFFTQPIAVSRNVTSPRDKYGRSPAMKVLGTIKGVNEMAKTILRAGHKAVDPALAFYDDGDISKLATKPGGLNPGLVSPDGRLLVQPIPQGGNMPLGFELLERERDVIKTAFLEEFFKILTDPADRMTATQVLEMVAKQGVLIAPFADRYETEKLSVMIEREIDVGLRTGLIDPMPPEMVEAGARPVVVMDNPLAKMARAQEASGFTRWVEIGVQAAGAGAPEALDRINWDEGMKDTGEVLGVRPSHIRTDDEIAELRRQRDEKEAAAAMATVAPNVAGAALDIARANEVAANIAQGGGL